MGIPHFYCGIPIPSDILGQCSRFEVIKTIDPGIQSLSVLNLPLGIPKFQAHRMSGGEGFLRVLENEGQMNGIAGPPNAPLTVKKALEAFLDPLPGDIKRTGFQNIGIHDPQITLLPL